MKKLEPKRDFLTLWRWGEALNVNGKTIESARGTHSGGLNSGDRMFVWAVSGEELYILGVIEIDESGPDWARGKSVYGPFMMVPLKQLKWRLRFLRTKADRLIRGNLAMQVRSRRRPDSKTVELLESRLLQSHKERQLFEKEILVREGKLKVVTLSKRERSPKLRAHVLAIRGYRCQVCEFDFIARYGKFAEKCVELHHLKPVASASRRGRATSSDEVIVVCPNCHRALHQLKDSSNWRAFRKKCRLRRERLVEPVARPAYGQFRSSTV